MGRPVKGFERTSLTRIREALGQSLDDLSGRTGICRTLLWRYEVGKVRPTKYNLERIAAALSVPIELFLTDTPPVTAKLCKLAERLDGQRPRRMRTWLAERAQWYRVPRLFQLMPTDTQRDFQLPVEQFALFRLWWHSNRTRRQSYSRQFSSADEAIAQCFWQEQVLLGAASRQEGLYQGTTDYHWGNLDTNMERAAEFFLYSKRQQTRELVQYGFDEFLRKHAELRPLVVADA